MLTDIDTARPWPEDSLREAIAAAGVALWSWNVDTDLLEMDDRAFDLWSLPRRPSVTFEDLSEKIHPADRGRVRAAFSASRALSGAHEVDFRILTPDDVRWISARGRGGDETPRQRVLFGIFLDVTGRKQAEEAHELLAGEMSHRVKNLLTIATALTNMTARSATDTESMARELTGRLGALGRAHDYGRLSLSDSTQASLVGDLISVMLDPYDNLGAFIGRVRVSVPRLAIGDSAATNLALIIHELATNSVKYGALSVDVGTLDVTATVEAGDVTIIWTERGGPVVQAPKKQAGFGSHFSEKLMMGYFNGSMETTWEPEGVIAKLKFKAERLKS